MKNVLEASEFLWNLQMGDGTYPFETITLGIKPKFSFDLYRPKQNSKGTILTINGLAPLGPKDPRFMKVNEAFVKLGYTVLCPFLEEICSFKISKKNITDIVNVIELTRENEDLNLPKNIGIFAPSFSGGLSLIAATDPKVSQSIQSMLLVGSYSKVDELIRYLFETQETDEYGRLILLWNFMFLGLGERPKLKKALELTILDNYFKRNPGEFESFWNELDSVDRDIYLKVKNDPKFRMEVWDKVIQNGGEFVSLLQDLNVTGKLGYLFSPVALVHGKNDDVVPSTQSKTVYDELKDRKIPAKLCITNLLGHGDTGFSVKALWEIFPLVVTFAFFFKNLKRKK